MSKATSNKNLYSVLNEETLEEDEVELKLSDKVAQLEKMGISFKPDTKALDCYKIYKDIFDIILQYPKAANSLFKQHFGAKGRYQSSLPQFISQVTQEDLRIILYIEANQQFEPPLAKDLQLSLLMKYTATPKHLRTVLKNEHNEQKPITSRKVKELKVQIFRKLGAIALDHFNFETTYPVVELDENLLQHFINSAACHFALTRKVLIGNSWKHPITKIVSEPGDDDILAENLAKLGCLLSSSIYDVTPRKNQDIIQDLFNRKSIDKQEESLLRLFEFIVKSNLMSNVKQEDKKVLKFFKHPCLNRSWNSNSAGYRFRIDFKHDWKIVHVIHAKWPYEEITNFKCNIYKLLDYERISPDELTGNEKLRGLPDIQLFKELELNFWNDMEKRHDENPDIQKAFREFLIDKKYMLKDDLVTFKTFESTFNIEIECACSDEAEELAKQFKKSRYVQDIAIQSINVVNLTIPRDTLYELTRFTKGLNRCKPEKSWSEIPWGKPWTKQVSYNSDSSDEFFVSTYF